jgi:Bax protein
MNLNSHPAYAKLRLARYRMRLAGKKPDARLMAAGLRRYSAVGEKYVETVREMIRGNREFLGTQSRADS